MRPSVPAACAALILALSAVLMPGVPAAAAAVFVEINPDTVRAGDEVGLRASCDDNLTAATVTARPLGTVNVTPQFGLLTATVRVPESTTPGDYGVELRCSGGEEATGILHVVARVEPSEGPATGFGGTAGPQPSLLVGGGVAALVAGALLGVVALRRRRFG